MFICGQKVVGTQIVPESDVLLPVPLIISLRDRNALLAVAAWSQLSPDVARIHEGP